MKKIIMFLVVFCICNDFNAQDTIVSKKPFSPSIYKKLLAPAALILVGASLKSPEIQENIQKDVRSIFGENFHTRADDYLQFVPLAQMFGGNYLGLKSENSNKQMLANVVISNLLVTGVTFLGKTATKNERPDGSANNSFPSGHTATAFNNATLLFYQYKKSNIWYASSGYLFATTTALFRVANNRHWTGDVVAGAGIGIAIGTIVNYWQPFKFDQKKNQKVGFMPYPVINDKNYGIGLLCQIK